ncbi:hypothetical protein BU23DRAFT_501063 [Bimuria novae-zelandiae CBS 107.79]|uniref:Protein kinase domain-containing protein n=1 Tax=Bimuria novae-zelandiae CBS 107.79 TaxID=1447943 RepID=A0A6A5VJ29_9PLEO|nr:hypothetical protein BU23DRAFT_501063 [Bimuria novae-zelandiae CBS 107.79]
MDDDIDWVRSNFATSSYGTINHEFPVTDAQQSPPSAPRGSFASFVCHVTNLERKLRISNPIVLDDSSSVRATGKILGQGKTFMVRHALWTKDPNEPPLDVALKEVIPEIQPTDGTSRPGSNSMNRPQVDWKEILFEIRALLHEPIRYHPNIIRLLGIQWGLSPISESTFPVLIMEYASLGTLQSLQSSPTPLPLTVKQKLCYDVGRGLSALHASGIVHGDMKHENVLIFPYKVPSNPRDLTAASSVSKILYTAKLADFGGTVMDMMPDEVRKLDTGTWPFEAPEVAGGRLLTRDGMMLTDVYSFGLLVWRAFEDGNGFVSLPGAAQSAPDEDKRSLSALKATEQLVHTAVRNIQHYATTHGVPHIFVDLFTYIILHTVRLDPQERNLVKAQAALRGIKIGNIRAYLEFVREKNDERATTEARAAPGAHGITRDTLQFFLGQSGEDADLQDNLPGFRPHLDQPNAEEFTFEPAKLKNVLTWDQQQQMLDELKRAATDTWGFVSPLLELKKTVAAFYVFQCYLLEFGTTFDSEEAVQWLLKASSDDDSHEDEDYFAQAWIWRISRAFAASVDISKQRLETLLQLSVMRGHRTSLQDIHELASVGPNIDRQQWWGTYLRARKFLMSQMGAVGMGYFFSSHLTPPWNTLDLSDLASLDTTIRARLGDSYRSCLRSFSSQPAETSSQVRQDRTKTPFDRIYINRRGHGPLHYASAAGNAAALQHLLITYECDLDLPNQHVDETPLLCACAGGQLECAMFLLDNGADPNGYRFSQEGPLHWLSSFVPGEMETIARRLVAAGADLELRSNGMRHDVRGIRADWEHIFEIRTTPLGRAVLMNNLDAVKVLLQLGANPLTKSAVKHRGEWEGMENMSKMIDVVSPFELASILTYPEILAAFITHIDVGASSPSVKLLDEVGMLGLARSQRITHTDPLSLQSRLVRCGSHYKQNLKATLLLLYARALPFNGGMASEEIQKERSKLLCREVSLGNVDVVKTLLELRYHVDGTQYHRPIAEAVKLNHDALFDLLNSYQADLSVTRMTPTGAISLLHVCASRPRQSRPGRHIADALIAARVPLESADPRSRSPLALAILNQNFDIACALVEAGANVDTLYPLRASDLHGPDTKHTTVLVEVLSQHTMRTLESLKFLFERRDGGPRQRPAFHIDPANKFSILHLLAGSPNFTQIAQITPKILNLCLDTYNEAEFVDYRHPLLGSALFYAAANGHKAMVERLLEHGADKSVGAGPVMRDSVQALLRPQPSWTPLWAAILRLDEEFRKGELLPLQIDPFAWIHSVTVQNLEKCIALLSTDSDDALANQAVDKLRQKKISLEENERSWRAQTARESREFVAREAERPLDLGILSGSGGNDEIRIREICQEPEVDWRTDQLEQILGNLRL